MPIICKGRVNLGITYITPWVSKQPVGLPIGLILKVDSPFEALLSQHNQWKQPTEGQG